VAYSFEIKVCEVCEGNGGSAFIKRSSEKRPSDDCDHLKVEQFRRHETFTL
jgi:hypothetical protein